MFAPRPRVVEAVVKAVNVPVTVKIRAGWDERNPTAVEFARAAEGVGVKAIAVHARFATQGFTGEPDWSWIRRVKEAVSIPVIGNGDVLNADDAARMFAETGCDAVMIGRGALGRPWIFHHIAHKLRTGETLPDPLPAREDRGGAHARAADARRHAPLAAAGDPRNARAVDQAITSACPARRRIREQLVHINSLADVEAAAAPRARTGARTRTHICAPPPRLNRRWIIQVVFRRGAPVCAPEAKFC